MHRGIPLNCPYVPQIQISTDVPVFRSSARVSEKHNKDLSPPPPHHPPRIILGFKAKLSTEQVVVEDF